MRWEPDKSGSVEAPDIDTRTPKNARAYPHYYRPVPNSTHIDVYRVLDMFEVRRSSVAHAVKKLLCSGLRGAKDELQDLKEARDSIERQIEMLEEDMGSDVGSTRRK